MIRESIAMGKDISPYMSTMSVQYMRDHNTWNCLFFVEANSFAWSDNIAFQANPFMGHAVIVAPSDHTLSSFFSLCTMIMAGNWSFINLMKK